MRFRTLTAVLTGAVAATAFIAGTATSTVADPASTSRLVLRDGPGDVWKFSPRTEEQTRVAFARADVELSFAHLHFDLVPLAVFRLR